MEPVASKDLLFLLSGLKMGVSVREEEREVRVKRHRPIEYVRLWL